MFTGIISAVATVKKAEKKAASLYITIEKPKSWKLAAGDSVNSDGVCLTVNKLGTHAYQTALMPQTLSTTSFGKAVPQRVNLERPLQLRSLLDGHLVQGHVDTVGTLKKIVKNGDSKLFTVSFPPEYRKLMVAKGSIAVDGISLTIVDCGKDWFSTSLVDYTLKHTTMDEKKVGDLVNLEFDIIAKYISKQLGKP